MEPMAGPECVGRECPPTTASSRGLRATSLIFQAGPLFPVPLP